MTDTAWNRETERPLRAAGRPEFAISRDDPWIDTALVALVFGAILFNLVIGKLSVIAVLLATGLMLLLRWERLPQAALRCWPLFTLPAYCLASALWSDVPQTTLYYASLYTATALTGVLIGSVLDRGAYIDGHFLAFSIYAIACVFFGREVPHNFGIAFAGLAGSKNSAGDMAGVGMIVTIAFVAFKIYQAKLVQAAFGLLVFPILAIQLLASQATGALIATTMACILAIGWMVSRRFEIQLRSGLLVFSVIVIILGAVTMQYWFEPVFGLVIDVSGKGTGLTGRVRLWEFGERLIAERPWLGLGYSAFWLQDSLNAQFLWSLMGIASQQGFNFHNTPMEIIIHLGYPGLVLAVVMALSASASLFFRAAIAPYFSSICACALLAFWTVKTPLEVIGFDPMNFNTVTVYAIFAMGLRRDAKRAPKKQPQASGQRFRDEKAALAT